MATRFKKEVLLADERNRALSALVRYGPHLFLSGSDGNRDLDTNAIVPELDWQATPQCHNAYGRQALRLEQAGYSGEAAIWIENFTSGQHWRLERMATWPDHFGEVGHAQAVSFGAQSKMAGTNMLTAVVQGLDTAIPREVLVPQPTRGRASRITRAGEFTYVIGVRGRSNPFTGEEAPEETDDQFDVELLYTYEWLRSHLEKGGGSLDDLVSTHAALRSIAEAQHYRERLAEVLGGQVALAPYAVGTLLGGHGVMEIGGIAVNPGEKKEVAWLPGSPKVAQAVKANGLVFAGGCSGLADAKTGKTVQERYGDKDAQVAGALRRLEAALNKFDATLADVLRLDVFLDDIYYEDRFIAEAAKLLGPEPPAMNIIGVDLEGNAEVEVSAIAGCPA
ncbi:MAG: Rid family hydrolase [Chloroflexota bacterium]